MEKINTDYKRRTRKIQAKLFKMRQPRWSRQLSVWEYLKALLSQSPLFYQQQRNSRCLLREVLCDI